VKLRINLFNNLSITHFNLKKYNKAIEYCEEVLYLDDKNIKASLLLGKVY